MSDGLLRKMLILHHLPQYPAKITTRRLLELLDEQSIGTSLRTVQRDLEHLSSLGIYGISADKDSKPAGWYWMKQARRLQIPYMDINTAIAFNLMEAHAESLLPSGVRDHIQPFFDQSQQLLKDRHSWNTKISLAPTRRSQNHAVDPKARDLIYQALDEGKCISAKIGRYIRPPKFDYIHYTPLYPIGLRVEREETYLLAHTEHNKQAIWFALYRFKDVEILDQQTDERPDEGIKHYCSKQQLRDCFNKNIDLKIEVDEPALRELMLYPLGEQQEVETITKNRFQISVTTDEDRELRRRLLNLGSHITVLSPRSIISYIQNEALQIQKNYTMSDSQPLLPPRI